MPRTKFHLKTGGQILLLQQHAFFMRTNQIILMPWVRAV
jgi:hypothetical protein